MAKRYRTVQPVMAGTKELESGTAYPADAVSSPETYIPADTEFDGSGLTPEHLEKLLDYGDVVELDADGNVIPRALPVVVPVSTATDVTSAGPDAVGPNEQVQPPELQPVEELPAGTPGARGRRGRSSEED